MNRNFSNYRATDSGPRAPAPGPRISGSFTLLELIVSMAVFTLLMYTLLLFFDSAQKAWVQTSHRGAIYENTRVAFDLIERDIVSVFYEQDRIPFWHKGVTDATWGNNRNEMLCFVSNTNTPPNGNCISKLCEIKYQLHYPTDFNDADIGWLMRSATGDHLVADIDHPDGVANTKWNFYDNFLVGMSGTGKTFTANTDSSDAFARVIPYVTNVIFTCYKLDGSEITPDTNSSSSSCTGFPYAVRVDISMMSRNSYMKWIALSKGGAPNANTFRSENEITFTKTFLIGERGQYD